MKGIILAGGAGTRLNPLTHSISKQLLPIYNKPMIYYSLSTLMLAGIREVLIIVAPDQEYLFRQLLGSGSKFGIEITYKVQPRPNGIAEAFIIGRDFISNDNVTLILGDNIFYGNQMSSLIPADGVINGASIFCISVPDPDRFGVAVVNDDHTVRRIVEKPTALISNWAVTGLYVFDNTVVDSVMGVRASKRGELEITDLLQIYVESKKIEMTRLGRGFTWFDTGTHSSLLDAANFVRTIEKRQGLMIGCLEEISLANGWLTAEELEENLAGCGKSSYYVYLRKLIGVA